MLGRCIHFGFGLLFFGRINKFAGGATRGGAGARIVGRGGPTIVGACTIPLAELCAGLGGSMMCQRLRTEIWLVVAVLEPTVEML